MNLVKASLLRISCCLCVMNYITPAKCLGLTGNEKLIIFIMHDIVSICNFLITNKNEGFSLLFIGTTGIKITFYHLGKLNYKLF